MRSVLALAMLALPAWGMRDTAPFLVWNDNEDSAWQQALAGGKALVDGEAVYKGLKSLGCAWDNAVVVHVDKLHHSKLDAYNTPSDAHLHIPYVKGPSRRGLSGGLEDWASACEAEVVGSLEEMDGGRQVVDLWIKEGEVVPWTEIPSSALIVLTGSPPTHTKRQEYPFPSNPSSSSPYTYSESQTAPSIPTSTSRHSTIPPKTAPLLDRVQILTTPIITALLITFGIFIPLLAFAITQLVGIQVPPMMLNIIPREKMGKERKDQ
ncbi:hypothetical protein L202_07729 [Cryptococcus amylolentus CBS 6039]|uniref:Protein BIG1 n=2 Tax=Cryptococcus amylolentus TaxID=104669 RepID=A0A1E3HA36_9TREE|nr:hypothetical protein L202_07729 [Cryptococcus amylolentus CBS 6039]ODN73164.1 hypothetical protein L202_07729 [Cryptococcus amylolentus CBS 6039]ODN98992.1 hypothetical protein I350_07144 [Cryptococcus amylolentus CBS 6273]